jgi:hypothetical protein
MSTSSSNGYDCDLLAADREVEQCSPRRLSPMLSPWDARSGTLMCSVKAEHGHVDQQITWSCRKLHER